MVAAIQFDCPIEIIDLLLTHGGDPDAEAPDGRTAYRLAIRRGRMDVADLMRSYGSSADATDVDHFIEAALRGDREAAQRLLRGHTGLVERLMRRITV